MAVYDNEDEDFESVIARLTAPGDLLDAQRERLPYDQQKQHLREMLDATRQGYEFDGPISQGTTAPTRRDLPETAANLASPRAGIQDADEGALEDPKQLPAASPTPQGDDNSFWETMGALQLTQGIGQGVGNIGQALGSLRPGGPGRPGRIDNTAAMASYRQAESQREQQRAQALRAAEQAYDQQLADRRTTAYEATASAQAEGARRAADWRENPENPQNQQRAAAADLSGVRAQGLSIANSQARERDDADNAEATALRETLRRMPADERQRLLIPADAELDKLDAQALQYYLDRIPSNVRLRMYQGLARGQGGGGGSRLAMQQAAIRELVTNRHMTEEDAESLVSALPTRELRQTVRSLITQAGTSGQQLDREARMDLERYANELLVVADSTSLLDRMDQSLDRLSDDEVRTAFVESRLLAPGARDPKHNEIIQLFEELQAQPRNDLFGASLTGNERDAWMRIAGDSWLVDPAAIRRFVDRRREVMDGVNRQTQLRYPLASRMSSGQHILRGPQGAGSTAPQASQPRQSAAQRPAAVAAPQQPQAPKRQYRVRTARGTAVYHLTQDEANQAISRYGAQNVEAL